MRPMLEEMVWTVPPGATPVVCISAGHSPETANVATLEVLDPGRLYVPIDANLRCDGRGAKTWELAAPLSASDPAGRFRSLRKRLRGVRSTDALQRAGYRHQRHVWVGILRDGEPVALVNLFPTDIHSAVYACIGSGIHPRRA